MPVKQMLDWRCARGKRRKIFIKKENSLSGREEIVREERICLSNGKEFLREEEIRKNWFVKKRRVFSRRRLGQVAYLSGREELVNEEKLTKK